MTSKQNIPRFIRDRTPILDTKPIRLGRNSPPSSPLSDSTSPSPSNSPPITRPSSPFLKLSLSATSLTSFFQNKNVSTPNLGTNWHKKKKALSHLSNLNLPSALVSDLLARESDVIVSTNITSQLEYKGFAAYVVSGIFLTLWLFWSLCPDQILTEVLGIYYYPSRWWALLIPSFILVSMGYTYVALLLYNIEVKTRSFNGLETIVDDSGVVVTQLDQYDPLNENFYFHRGTSGIWDLTISDVNRVLYGRKAE